MKKENLSLKAPEFETRITIMHPGQLSIHDFSYHLPDEKIARFPLSERDQSKLLVYRQGTISDHQFTQLPELLPSHGLLVVNNTRVIHARIFFQKPSGAKIEVFCLEPFEQSYKDALGSTHQSTWKCMVGNAKRWKGEVLTREFNIGTGRVTLCATPIADNKEMVVKFTWNEPGLTFAHILAEAGLLPIPPYLKRGAETSDENNYQTVYARNEGSVAAPTAGLHFTPALNARLNQHGIETAELTLHVGAGTFKPVKSATMQEHEMHHESVSVPLDVLRRITQALGAGRPIVPVGTTSLRTLESIYWHGVKLISNMQSTPVMNVGQWEPYQLPAAIPAVAAYDAVINHLTAHGLQTLEGQTGILIAPGYSFKIAGALITNFHQPNSTLLLLVAAFVGRNWTKIYDHALKRDYRFLSFGDSSLLFRDQ